jgi:hypothetical protein
MLGAAAAFGGSCAIAWLMDPNAWKDYSLMMRTYGVEKEFIPCWSVVLRLWIHPQALWIQSVLPLLGCGWAAVYFWRRRHAWDWLRESGLLMAVSIVAAPYCWVFDQAVAIPALLHGSYLTRSRVLLVLLSAASLAIEVALVRGVKLPSAFFLWTAPAWLIWYLAAMRLGRGNVPGDS